MHMCLNAHGHSADPLPQVQIVRALVQKNASAFSTPGRAPGSGIIICLRAVPVGNDPIRTPNAAVRTALYQLAHFPINVIRPLIKHHAENYVGFSGTLIHLPDLLRIYARRLFHHHVKSLFHGRNCKSRVVVMRDRHKHRVYNFMRRVFNQRIAALISNGVRQMLLCPLQALGVEVGHGRNRDLGAFSL